MCQPWLGGGLSLLRLHCRCGRSGAIRQPHLGGPAFRGGPVVDTPRHTRRQRPRRRHQRGRGEGCRQVPVVGQSRPEGFRGEGVGVQHLELRGPGYHPVRPFWHDPRAPPGGKRGCDQVREIHGARPEHERGATLREHHDLLLLAQPRPGRAPDPRARARPARSAGTPRRAPRDRRWQRRLQEHRVQGLGDTTRRAQRHIGNQG
mmetsp:Transcript_142922/g.398235  ORF Transcript_142922/g.398235 Transcript_142922/m.398235 type:complete len:204 (-) Transcript_142922:385-996(-)